MTEPAITPDPDARPNLNPEEFARIQSLLGRDPFPTELALLSDLSRARRTPPALRTCLNALPTRPSAGLDGSTAGRPGFLDLGDGWIAAFQTRSDPLAPGVDPFLGAAAGVGCLLRSIVASGARPVAALHSLRFGDLMRPEVRRYFAGVVAGLAQAGNTSGIPTVGSEIHFDPDLVANPPVHTVGIGVLRSTAGDPGANPVASALLYHVGPAAGRDGITDSPGPKPAGAARVADPFLHQRLTEACLELFSASIVVGMAPMDEGGLAGALRETCARPDVGIEIELSRVPRCDARMSLREILASESPERMLVLVREDLEPRLKSVLERWEIPACEIGKATNSGRIVVRQDGDVLVDLPSIALAQDSPSAPPEAVAPAPRTDDHAFRLDAVPDTCQPMLDLKSVLAWPSVASKNWVHRQYDHTVGNGSVVGPGFDAAVVRVKLDFPTSLTSVEPAEAVPEKLVALTLDGHGGYGWLEPYEGGKIAVAQAARNLACSGAVPVGAGVIMNFASPRQSELAWQCHESARGVAEACQAFRTPILESAVEIAAQVALHGPVDPTPTVAMVGLVEKPEHVTTPWFKNEGDAILLLGAPTDPDDPLQGLGGSAHLQVVHGRKTGTPPRCRLEAARTLHTTLVGLIHGGGIRSAHDCSDGGLAVALAECCLTRTDGRHTPRLLGASLDFSELRGPGDRLDALLFGEVQSRVVVSCAALDAGKLLERARILGVPAARIGTVGGDRLSFKIGDAEHSVPLKELHDLWWNAVATAMQ